MKYILPLAALLIASCATTDPASPSSASAGSNIRYRYTNTLNLGNDLTMDQVSVIGYDDHSVGESTRLDVTVNNASITLRSLNDGNAMYTPSVEAGPEGTLVVGWGEIDDGGCRVRLAVKPDGSLAIVSRKELDYSAGRR
jgi:hypothetical protein